MQRTFKPVSQKVSDRRPPLFQPPSPENAQLIMSHLSSLLGVGILLAIGKIAKSIALPQRGARRQEGGGNINPRKRLNPSTSFLPN